MAVAQNLWQKGKPLTYNQKKGQNMNHPTRTSGVSFPKRRCEQTLMIIRAARLRLIRASYEIENKKENPTTMEGAKDAV